VFVIVLPEVEDQRRPTPDQLVLADDLRRKVLDDLRPRCVIGASVEVRLAHLTWVGVDARLVVSDDSRDAVVLDVQRQVERLLYEYVNPYTGGAGRRGWSFGRALHLSELLGLLQQVPQVEYVPSITMKVREPGQQELKTAGHRVALPAYGLLCSATHTVIVRRTSDETA
jgi:hypothetical protein